MTEKELIALIDHPDCLNEDTLPSIARLVEEYPYFQTARLLYVMNLCSIKDSTFAAELKKAAVYSGDRKHLFCQLLGDRFEKFRLALKTEKHSVKDTFKLIDSFLNEIGGETDSFPADIKKKAGVPSAEYQLEHIEQVDNSEFLAMKHQDIIDSFIEKNKEQAVKIVLEDTPGTPMREYYVEEEKEEFSSFFSETLAKIYIKQKKYDKALEIIRKLHLLYPEKSVYFADQIRFLEKLITNTKNS